LAVSTQDAQLAHTSRASRKEGKDPVAALITNRLTVIKGRFNCNNLWLKRPTVQKRVGFLVLSGSVFVGRWFEAWLIPYSISRAAGLGSFSAP
jgi:hypothetical protein